MSGTDVDIAVIGAGAAGISAARRIADAYPAHSAVLLEAGDHAGGRARTVEVTGWPLDLGCGWLHSAERNSWRERADARGIAVDRTPPLWERQSCDLGISRAEQAEARAAFAAWEDRVLAAARSGRDRPAAELLDPAGRWNPFIEALSGYINGTGTARLSVLDYAAYAEVATDKNWRLPGGYGTLVAGEAHGLDLRLRSPVRAIDHSGRQLRLDTAAGTLTARAAIITVSTEVLAAGAIRFTPALPDKIDAAAALPLGLADKLFLAIDGPALFPADGHLLGSGHRAETISYQLCPFGRPVIEAFSGGALAERIAREPDPTAAFAAWALDELAALAGSSVRAALRPIAASSWRNDPLVRGSYSHALPGHATARAALAAPVADRLFFAGEACSAHDFSTAHGARDTGIAAADAAATALGSA